MRASLTFWMSIPTLVIACGESATPPAVVRLVDAFPSANIFGASPSPAPPEPTEWRFDGPSPSWKAGPGIAQAAVREGRLTGRSATDVPILQLERPARVDPADVLQEVVIRARVSSGSNLAVNFSEDEAVDLDRLASRVKRFPWPLSTPLLPGEQIQTYTISAGSAARTSFPASGIRHVLLQPTDVEAADFEIESVRLVFRREHLAKIPSGVSWQGLSEIYRETIVTRSPEDARFTVTLPPDPVLDLAVGTVEDGPVTFSVVAEAERGEERLLVRRTITTPNRWHEVTFDLPELASRETTLSLRLEALEPGAIGFWGAPAIRGRSVWQSASRESHPRPRGVLVVLLDTLRQDHLEAYGYERETAPSVAALAREGVRFQNAIAQGAWTKVSVPSILSSTYPSSNGVYELFHKLPASADTLAESFREAGWATWGASGNGFSGRANNLHQGLEVLHERGSIEVPDGQSRSKTARPLVDRLLEWLETHHDLPFFVFLHPIDPHSPYEPYRPYDALWGEPGDSQSLKESIEKVKPLVEERERNGRLPHREDLVDAGLDPDVFNARELAWYDGSIRAADVEIGRVLERLRELGLEEDTLVVFLSDHGEEFRDHGGGFHEDNVYGELTNVPLILRWPRVIPSGVVVEETVQLLDVAPTLLELAGIAVPGRMQGTSLVPLFLPEEGRRWASRPAISEWKRRIDQLENGVDAFSIVLDGYKLVHNVQRPPGFPEFELYERGKDPLDQHDRAKEHPELVERLSTQLGRWREWAAANKLPTDEQEAGTLDAEELERLRSLGYVQ
ncbi:MAG TPA: sulfatase [Vicinamibacteria bacterium]|nr:sulfatase [Vicinamibacteria bacterium]